MLKHSKRILVLSSIATQPINAGHRLRIFRLLEDLAELGHEIHFVYLNGKCQPKDADVEAMRRRWKNHFYTPAFKEFNNFFKLYKTTSLEDVRECRVDDWYDDDFTETFKNLADQIKPDIVIAEYIMLSKSFEALGKNVLKVLDTLDVFASRNKKLNQNGIFYHETTPSFSAEDEIQAINRADIILAIQDLEKAYFEKVTSKDVRTLGHRVDLYPAKAPKIGKKILFAGGRGLINKANIENFIINIFPKIRAQEPAAELAIVGNICDLLDKLPAGCTKLGYADDLRPFYEEANVVVNSDLFATGLSIKTITGLGHAKPLVTTTAGGRGLEYAAGKAFLLAETPQLFSEYVVSLLRNPDQAAALSENAYKFSVEYNRKCQETLSELFGS